MQFNQFNLYSMNAGGKFEMPKDDAVDTCINEVRGMNVYDEIKSYLTERFGDFSGEKWVEYPELHKQMYLKIEGDIIEVCALKNEQQYFGQGWKLINKE